MLYNDTDGKLYWDADGTGVAKATLLATFEGLDPLQIVIANDPVDQLNCYWRSGVCWWRSEIYDLVRDGTHPVR